MQITESLISQITGRPFSQENTVAVFAYMVGRKKRVVWRWLKGDIVPDETVIRIIRLLRENAGSRKKLQQEAISYVFG